MGLAGLDGAFQRVPLGLQIVHGGLAAVAHGQLGLGICELLVHTGQIFLQRRLPLRLLPIGEHGVQKRGSLVHIGAAGQGCGRVLPAVVGIFGGGTGGGGRAFTQVHRRQELLHSVGVAGGLRIGHVLGVQHLRCGAQAAPAEQDRRVSAVETRGGMARHSHHLGLIDPGGQAHPLQGRKGHNTLPLNAVGIGLHHDAVVAGKQGNPCPLGRRCKIDCINLGISFGSLIGAEGRQPQLGAGDKIAAGGVLRRLCPLAQDRAQILRRQVQQPCAVQRAAGELALIDCLTPLIVEGTVALGTVIAPFPLVIELACLEPLDGTGGGTGLELAVNPLVLRQIQTAAAIVKIQRETALIEQNAVLPISGAGSLPQALGKLSAVRN